VIRAKGGFGRSAYVCASAECVESALKREALSRALRVPFEPHAKDELRKELECRLR